MKNKLTIEQFLDTVKVLRMLYGIHIAQQYFEDNFNTFYGEDFQTTKISEHGKKIWKN